MTQFRDPILHIGLMLRCSQTECKSELSWYSVSARCWDALTLQQQADLTCCDKLPHCQCSFCIPFFLLLYSECNKYWVCEKGFDGLCCSQFCFSFIFMKKTCILSYILCCCFDICNNVAGKWEILVWRLWANSMQALSNTIHESHTCNWESDEDEMIEENLDFHKVNLPQGQVTRTFAIISYAKETTWTHLYHNKSAYDCT
jgi:hypothetical protein